VSPARIFFRAKTPQDEKRRTKAPTTARQAYGGMYSYSLPPRLSCAFNTFAVKICAIYGQKQLEQDF
jgi:hypothetical protein